MRILLIALVTMLLSSKAYSQCNPNFVFSVNGQTVSFIDQSTTGQGSIVSYYWNFGDGDTSALANPVHTYPAPGMYNVQHSIQNSLGTCDSTQDIITMVVMIEPAFYHVSLCPPVASTLLQAASFGSSYQWQLSSDSTAYTNLVAGSNYAGVQTSQLQIINIPSSFTGYRYRCVIDGSPAVPYRLQFVNNWIGAQNNLWSNAANWSCAALPDIYTDVIITTGTLTVDINAAVRSLTVYPPATVKVLPGVTLTVLQ